MSWSDARNSILSVIMNEFDIKDVAVGWDNSEFIPEPNKPWVRFTISPVVSVQSTLNRPGERKFKRSGLIGVSIGIPTGTWTAKLDEIAEKVIDILEARQIGEVTTLASSYTQNGIDGSWFLADMVIDFYFFDIR